MNLSCRAFLALFVSSVFSTTALATPCETCWTPACPALASYLPACAQDSTSVQSKGYVTLHSVPEGLVVRIDGTEAGITPISNYAVPSGRIVLRSDSTDCLTEARAETHVAPNARMTVTLRPEPKAAIVVLTNAQGSPQTGVAFVDGQEIGEAVAPLHVPVCAQTLEVRDPAGKTWSTPLSLAVGTSVTLQTSLREAEVVSPSAEDSKENRCYAGDGALCRALALEAEKKTRPDWRAVARFHRFACDTGEWQSCGRLAELHEEGQGVERNLAQTARLHETACRANVETSCRSKERLEKALAEKEAEKERERASKASSGPSFLDTMGDRLDQEHGHVMAAFGYNDLGEATRRFEQKWALGVFLQYAGPSLWARAEREAIALDDGPGLVTSYSLSGTYFQAVFGPLALGAGLGVSWGDPASFVGDESLAKKATGASALGELSALLNFPFPYLHVGIVASWRAVWGTRQNGFGLQLLVSPEGISWDL